MFIDVPVKDLPYPRRRLLVDLDVRRNTSLPQYPPIAIRHPPEDRFPLAESKELAAAIALGDLGPLSDWENPYGSRVASDAP
jgi:hypothetical protein